MKGIVFTEFIEMVEDRFGMLTVDSMIEKAALGHSASYTAVGTYPHEEMVKLVVALSESTGMALSDLLFTYGQHFFTVLEKSYPTFFERQTSALNFLESIESYIHPEVLKLYPDAELPHFDMDRLAEGHLNMTYHSTRKMGEFAHGLILGTLAHFREEADITIVPLEADGSVVRFEVVKK